MTRYRDLPAIPPEKAAGRLLRLGALPVLATLVAAVAGIPAHAAVLSAADASPARGPADDAAAAARSDSTVTVEMLNYGYDPEPIRVSLGDTVRFVNATDVPHDAAYGEVPEGARLSSEQVTPFLAQKGESHAFVIDDRFVPGTYQIYCTPHRQLGMEGELVVTGPEAAEPDRSVDGTRRAAISVPPAPATPPAPDPPSVPTFERPPAVSVGLAPPIPTQDSASASRTHRRLHRGG